MHCGLGNSILSMFNFLISITVLWLSKKMSLLLKDTREIFMGIGTQCLQLTLRLWKHTHTHTEGMIRQIGQKQLMNVDGCYREFLVLFLQLFSKLEIILK